MLSVASLLNPVRPEPRGTRLPSSPSLSLCTSSSSHGSSQLSTQPSSIKKQKMTKDGAIWVKGKIKGDVNFPPFERLDEETMREVRKFRARPIGEIKDYARHIPYNSEKKSFLEKTGRESFEVFWYVFYLPGEDKEYTVMWDYNIGLVRITPFFKCCKYSKTTPAKMLNLNPGLKEITHSITGGALAAQGYWMPFSCALAVCTTFCAHIAGALIPIFGPTFPSLCVPVEAPEHGRMIIDPQLVMTATAEAEAYRLQYSNYPTKSTRESYSPHRIDHSLTLPRASPPTHALNPRLRVKRAFGGETPYGLNTTTDTDDTNASESSSGNDYYCSPITPVSANSMSHSQWTSHNALSHASNASLRLSPHFKTPNPLLSAIPRSSGLSEMHIGTLTHNWRPNAKRRAEEVDADEEYDGEESAPSIANTDDKSLDGKDITMIGTGTGEDTGGAEKRAAWLLMKLSVKDGESGDSLSALTARNDEGPRIKRRRATSM